MVCSHETQTLIIEMLLNLELLTGYVCLAKYTVSPPGPGPQ